MDFSSFLKSLPTSSRLGPSEPKPAVDGALVDVSTSFEASTSDNRKASSSLEQRLAGGANKSASDALAAAAGKRAWNGEASLSPIGKAVDTESSHAVINLDERRAGEALSQLEGTTITRYASEPSEDLFKLIAVNEVFITYALQKGDVRVLHKQTGLRALLKDHDGQALTHLRFFGDDAKLLASADVSGRLVVWSLSCEGEEVKAQTVLSISVLHGTVAVEGMRLDSPQAHHVIAASAASNVLIIPMPAFPKIAAGSQVDVENPPSSVIMVPFSSEASVSALAFSPASTHLAAGSTTGAVKIVKWPGVSLASPAEAVAEASAGGSVSSLTWLAEDLLLVGSISNTELQIWKLHPELGIQHQQTAVLRSAHSLLNSLAFDVNHGIVLLSNIRGSTLTAMHLTASRDSFDAVSQFQLTMPICSLEAFSEPLNGAASAPIQVYTVQTQAIQQYSLLPELCLPAPDRHADSVLPPSSAAHASPPTSQPSLLEYNSFANRARPTEANDSAFGETAALSSGSGPATRDTDAVLPATLTAPQPALLTPSQLIHAAKAALPRSVSGNSSVVEGEAGTRKPGASSFSRWTSSLAEPQSSAPIRAPSSGADAVEPDEGAASAPSPSPSPTEEQSDSIATANLASTSGPNLPTPASNGQSTSRTARSPEAPPGGMTAKTELQYPSSAVQEALDAARQALQGGKADPSKAVATAEGGIATLTELYERLQKDQRKLIQQQQQNHQATVRALRDDIRKEAKRLEGSTEAQIAKLARSQMKTIVDERKALIAEERLNLEKLLVAISGSINRDLPQRIEDIIKREVAAVTTQLGPAVALALSEALPREFAGSSLQTSVEKALAGQLKAALAKPIQEGFRSSFEQQVLPAFEAACRNMFAQVQATFAGGLAEHLQAAGGADAAVTASLRESVGQASAAAAKLSDDVSRGLQQLLALASQELQGRRGAGKELALTIDHKEELSVLLESHRYDDAFSKALDLGDVGLVVWLCSKVDSKQLLGSSPPLLSQHIMLVLLQHLGYDLSTDTSLKVRWVKELAEELDPQDPMLVPHARSVLQTALGNIRGHNFDGRDLKSARFATALLESALQTCQQPGS